MNRQEKLTAYWTLTRKETLRALRVWKQTLVPPVLTMTLYFLIFGKFIGSQLSEVQGFTYMQFLVPGLIMMPSLTSSFSHAVFVVYMGRFSKNIEDILVSPMSPLTIVLSVITSAMSRGITVSILVTIISLLFNPLKIFNIWIVALFIILTTMIFALLGFIAGLFSRNFDDTMLIPNFVLTPLTYLGGVFYSIQALPAVWQSVSKLNPILYMINGFRYGFLGISDVSIVFATSLLIACIIVLFCTSTSLMKKGVGIRT